jgi:tetratricopeptide (TPR) repeat protein
VADFDRVIALVPQHAEAYLQRALVRGELGQYREALADLEVCLTLDRAPAEARYQQAVMHEHLGEAEQARAAYRAFLRAARRRDPNAPRARARLEELGGD